jgi:hypothetical protein
MKKRGRWLLLEVALIGMIGGGLYEMSTHALRGWWGGEAHYDGRPTSFWRASIQSWAARFDTPDDAEQYLFAHSIDAMTRSSIVLCPLPRPTFLGQARIWIGLGSEEKDNWPPMVLRRTTDAVAVLHELCDDPEIGRFVERARRSRILWEMP